MTTRLDVAASGRRRPTGWLKGAHNYERRTKRKISADDKLSEPLAIAAVGGRPLLVDARR